ncbi:unnamed protein product, partial [Rotaria sp. Silwood2]
LVSPDGGCVTSCFVCPGGGCVTDGFVCPDGGCVTSGLVCAGSVLILVASHEGLSSEMFQRLQQKLATTVM